MSTPLLEASGLVVAHAGRVVLRVPHLALHADQTLALLGPNGAGKSTLLQAIGLLLPLAAGEILLEGRPIRGGAAALAARRRMAMVLQEPLLFDTSVERNVASGLHLRRLPRAEVARRVERWLAALGIAHLARRPARALSGGEAQRVSLARALAIDPDLLLLDEPFAALDPLTRAAVLDDIAGLLHRPGRAVVVVTHDRAEALRLADIIGVVIDGQVAQLGPPAVVFGRPVTPAVATFVGVETILPGEVVAAEAGLLTVGVGPHRLTTPGALAVGRRVQVCLRPEDVALTVGDGMSASPTSVRNHLPGRIGRVSPRGAVAVALVEIDGGLSLSVLVTSASALELGLAPGRPVVAAIKASAIHLIPREGADAPASPPV